MDPSDAKDAAKLFLVTDFAGKAMSSNVRGAIADVQFDNFTKVCMPDCVCICLSVHACFVCVYLSVHKCASNYKISMST